MSKKAVKKTAKPAAKKSAPKKAPAKKSAPAKSESALNKRYLHSETEDFYARHPNIKPLLILFMLVATAVFIYLVKMRMALAMM